MSTFSDTTLNMKTQVCYVKFDKSEDVGVAMHLSNTVFVDRPITIEPYAPGMFDIYLFVTTYVVI